MGADTSRRKTSLMSLTISVGQARRYGEATAGRELVITHEYHASSRRGTAYPPTAARDWSVLVKIRRDDGHEHRRGLRATFQHSRKPLRDYSELSAPPNPHAANEDRLARRAGRRPNSTPAVWNIAHSPRSLGLV